MSGRSENVYTIFIDSKNRVSGTPDNFKVRWQPQITDVHFISLMSCVLPFNFNNVTSLYGNSLPFTLTSGVAAFSSTLRIPIGFYSLDELLTFMNTALSRLFNTHYSQPSPISFSLGTVPNRVLLSYNATYFTSPATLTFHIPPMDPTTKVVPLHLFRMLGLPIDQDTVYAFDGHPSLTYTQPFPLSASAQLPISAILIHIESLPTKVITSAQVPANFYVDIEIANLRGDLIALPVSFKAYNDYFNSIELSRNQFNFAELKVTISDNNGKPLTEQNVIDWHMCFRVSTFERK